MRVSIFLLLITTVFAGAYLDYFHVRNDGDDAIIEWKTSQETNLKDFIIQVALDLQGVVSLAKNSITYKKEAEEAKEAMRAQLDELRATRREMLARHRKELAAVIWIRPLSSISPGKPAAAWRPSTTCSTRTAVCGEFAASTT